MLPTGSRVVLLDVALTVNDEPAVSASQMPNQNGPAAVSFCVETSGMGVIWGPRFLRISSGTSDASPYSREAKPFTPLETAVELSFIENRSSVLMLALTWAVASNLAGVAWKRTSLPSEVLGAGRLFQVIPPSVQESSVTQFAAAGTFCVRLM